MADTDPDFGQHALDESRIAGYLRDRLRLVGFEPSELAGHMTLAQLPGGRSNLTYLVTFGSIELVLRRPPFGPLPPAAHDVVREYRWLSALAPIFPLAPRPYLLCEDVEVAGASFSVMEKRRGVVLREEEPPSLRDRPDQRARTSRALIETLASLHAVDIRAPELAALGKPAGFVARQVRGWTERWRASETTALPDMDAVARWLSEHLPPDPARQAIVHGDFKLDNVMLDEQDPGRVTAVLDWEMSALGDPLVDLGIFLTYWTPTAPPGDQAEAVPLTTGQGWLTRSEIIDHYARCSGRSVENIAFYEVFARFKIAVVVQQLFHRYVQGFTRDSRFARFDGRVAYLARQAAALVAGP